MHFWTKKKKKLGIKFWDPKLNASPPSICQSYPAPSLTQYIYYEFINAFSRSCLLMIQKLSFFSTGTLWGNVIQHLQLPGSWSQWCFYPSCSKGAETFSVTSLTSHWIQRKEKREESHTLGKLWFFASLWLVILWKLTTSCVVQLWTVCQLSELSELTESVQTVHLDSPHRPFQWYKEKFKRWLIKDKNSLLAFHVTTCPLGTYSS